MKEVWKNIEGFNGNYQVSNLGNIKSLLGKKPRLLKQVLCKNRDSIGYYRVNLYIGKSFKHYSVHRLVLSTFNKVEDNKPHVNHVDGNSLNNNLNNLERCTPSENISHAFRIGIMDIKGDKNPNNKLTSIDVIEIRKIFDNKEKSIRELSNMYGVCFESIRKIVKRMTWLSICDCV